MTNDKITAIMNMAEAVADASFGRMNDKWESMDMSVFTSALIDVATVAVGLFLAFVIGGIGIVFGFFLTTVGVLGLVGKVIKRI